MTTTQDDTIAELQRTIAELQRGRRTCEVQRDAALAREATLAEALATRTAELATRNNEYVEQIEYQLATVDVLSAMSESPGDPQPVFVLITRHASECCNSRAVLWEFDGKLMHFRASHGAGYNLEAQETIIHQFPSPPDRGVISARAVLEQRLIHIADATEDPEIWPLLIDNGARSYAAIPLMRDGKAIGAISMNSPVAGGFSESRIELLQTFAEQAVIAITSAETYRALQTRTSDLQQSLEYQTATSDVLKVISRSAYDLKTVLQALLDTAARLCAADFGALMIRDGDVFRTSAIIPISPEHEAFVRRKVFVPSPHGSVVERTAFARQITHTEDIATLSDYVTSGRGFVVSGTALGVPLFLEGDVVGVFTLHRQRTEPFTDRQIELVSTFADQAVIAIENTRLITEQREALEQQTATTEILRVINESPENPLPVYDKILEKAHTVCGADVGALVTWDGTHFRALATLNYPEEVATLLSRPFLPNSIHQHLVDGQSYVHIPDAWALHEDSEFVRAFHRHTDLRTMLALALRKDNKLLGFVSAHRHGYRPYTDKEIALLESFADQAVIAMENARLINEQREALEQQTATAEVLQVINASPGNLVPVFDAMLEKALRLCGAAFGGLSTFDGERRTIVARTPAYEAYMTAAGETSVIPPMMLRLIETKRPVQIADRRDVEGARDGASVRTLLHVPLLKDETVLGCITVYRQEVRPYSDKEVALLENFASQAVIAMENARLLTETREALEQQTGTAEVLQVINASPGNLAPVFDAMLKKAIHLCRASAGIFWTHSGGQFRAAAVSAMPPAFVEFLRTPLTPGPATALARTVQQRRLMHRLADMREGDAYRSRDPFAVATVELGRFRSIVAMPLVKDGELLGSLSLYRSEVEAFTDKEVRSLPSFAAQAAIAMENARLINEQREALEQQTATAEVLHVINASPGNLAPVFDTVLEKAMRLCGAAFGSLFAFDGKGFQSVAQRGVPTPYAEFRKSNPPKLWPGSPIARLIATKRTIHVLDFTTEDIYRFGDADARSLTDLGDARTILFVPLLKDDAVLGFISIFRQEVRAFSDKQIALLENFAAQAVIAMESARLLHELRARTDELAQRQAELRITFENMGDGVAMFDETQHLVAWNRKFQEILDVPDDIIARRQTFSEYVDYLAARGEYDPEADPEEHVRRLIEQAGQSRTYERTRPDGRVIEIRQNPVPSGGFVLIYADITERKRNEVEIRAARDAAEEASRTIEAAYRELKTAQANLIQAEKMASLGQLTAGIAHEIKNPLNFVNNFAELSVDLLGELKDAIAPAEPALTEKQRAEVEDVSAMLTSNLEKITEHGKRADGIVKAMLEHSRGSSGERRTVDLNVLIDEALNLAYHGARAQDQSFNIALERDFGEGIAPIEVNPQDITRVFLNIFSNGFYAVTRRARDGADAGLVPTLKVTTRDAGEAVEIRVRDNGIGIPADIRDKLFQPFFTTKPTGEGTGLGLSITYDIVTQQHAGNIAVDSKVGEYSEFTIQLPR